MSSILPQGLNRLSITEDANVVISEEPLRYR